MYQYFIQGLLLGLAYVAPIGTQNLFVIHYALTQKRRQVPVCALIIAFFDISLSLACFLGIGALMSAFPLLELLVILIGSVVIIKMGIDLLRAKGGTVSSDENADMPIRKIIGTACVVTWFNPQAIIDGTMLLGASKASIPQEYGVYFIIGCAMASLLWWMVMPMVVSIFRTKVSQKVLRVINIICGLFILFYGVRLLYSGAKLVFGF